MVNENYCIGIMTFNHAEMALEALESARYQVEQFAGRRSVSLIVTDDASSDSTADLVKLWLDRRGEIFSRVVFIRNEENAGTVSNYNKIINISRANKLKIIGGDDLFSSVDLFNQLDRMPQNTIVTHPTLICNGNRVLFSAKDILRYYDKMVNKYDSIELQHMIRKSCFLSAPNTFFTKSMYKNSDCEELVSYFRLLEDYPTWYALLNSGNGTTVRFDTEPIVIYRKSVTSIQKIPHARDDTSVIGRDCKRMRQIAIGDSRGIERVILKLYDNTYSWPIVLTPYHWESGFHYCLLRVKYSCDKNYQSFLETMKEATIREQRYYDSIRHKVDSFFEDVNQ